MEALGSRRRFGLFFTIALVSLLACQLAYAGSATWDLNPTSNDWNAPANWTPDTVPNGPLDTATFDVSTTTSISLTANTEVNSIAFEAGASPFVISVLGQGTSPSTLTISGVGVVNNSGITQRLVTGPAASGGVGNITLTGNATNRAIDDGHKQQRGQQAVVNRHDHNLCRQHECRRRHRLH